MKKRRVLRIEQLEARETPDVSLAHSAVPIPPLPFAMAPSSPSSLAARAQFLEIATRLVEDSQTLLTAVAPPADNAFAGASSCALERLFGNSAELQELFKDSSKPVDHESVEGARRVQAANDGDLRSDGLADQLLASTLQGCRFLCNYVRKAIRNDEIRYGSCPDHEDMVHDVFVEWREQVGGSDRALSNLLVKNSAERQILSKAVRRVIDHARYEQYKQRRMVELIDQPSPVDTVAHTWSDMKIDWSSDSTGLSPRQQDLLELRSQGKTFEEIGLEMGLAKQRVFEIYESAIEQLQAVYSEESGRADSNR